MLVVILTCSAMTNIFRSSKVFVNKFRFPSGSSKVSVCVKAVARCRMKE